MSNSTLSLSIEGLQRLKAEEACIDGLYDDPKGFCTSGVGHLVHRADLWSSFLIAAVRQDADWKKFLAQSGRTQYLPRATAFDTVFGKIKGAAAAIAQTAIAKKKKGLDFERLSAGDSATIGKLAQSAVDTEASALAQPTDVTLRSDLQPIEAAVRAEVTVDLVQAEFDALVSFVFNVGADQFGKSTLLQKINSNQHATGAMADRKAALDAIRTEFAKWNRSGGAVLPGLVNRRAREAERFASARQGSAATTGFR
jgi:lysozyme